MEVRSRPGRGFSSERGTSAAGTRDWLFPVDDGAGAGGCDHTPTGNSHTRAATAQNGQNVERLRPERPPKIEDLLSTFADWLRVRCSIRIMPRGLQASVKPDSS